MVLSYFCLFLLPCGAVLMGKSKGRAVVVRVVVVLIVAVVLAFMLNGLAAGFFAAAEWDASSDGTLTEEAMQPDMPNLVVSLVLFGWIFLVAGNVVGQALLRRRT
ncbi:MAG: hypothetical protein KDN19_02275 [Verrucomicrobiae bacterium]|nr:hypothetical protein [Verrucomicrobiae bacterium]